MLLAASAVRDADTAAPWVMQIRDGHTAKTAVRLGLRSGGLVEVLEGLSEGDTVLADTVGTAALQPGARVRVAAR